ncbi:hypothetical protein [Legionella rubrilucens]|uniref:hypothetical protein n=1 Tax=Legionella rubrilucens TaxID=458 RepID=UPI00105697C6|nr:hypothetical protein [Legionella rubrilucens]
MASAILIFPVLPSWSLPSSPPPVLPELVSAIFTSSCLARAGGQPFESRLFCPGLGKRYRMVAFGQDINEYPGGFCPSSLSCLARADGQPFESRLFCPELGPSVT